MNTRMVIFSGFNYRAIISMCRVLEKNRYPFSIIALDKTDYLYATRYAAHIEAVRNQHHLAWADVEACLKVIQNNHNDSTLVILPTSEFLNHFLLQQRHGLKELNCNLPLVDNEIYQQVTNKQSFMDLCLKNDLNIPAPLKNMPEMPPFVAKPKLNVNAEGKSLYPYLITSSKRIEEFKNNEQCSDFYFEEFITGRSFYLLYYFAEDGRVIEFSQENYIQQGNGKSIVLAVSSDLHLKPINNNLIRLFHSINFRGLVMVELRYSDGKYYIIEANPRLWGPSQLFVDCNIPIFQSFLADFPNNENPGNETGPNRSDTYIWFNGIIQSLKNGSGLQCYISWKKALFLIMRHIFKDVYLRSGTLKLFFKELIEIIKEEE